MTVRLRNNLTYLYSYYMAKIASKIIKVKHLSHESTNHRTNRGYSKTSWTLVSASGEACLLAEPTAHDAHAHARTRTRTRTAHARTHTHTHPFTHHTQPHPTTHEHTCTTPHARTHTQTNAPVHQPTSCARDCSRTVLCDKHSPRCRRLRLRARIPPGTEDTLIRIVLFHSKPSGST